MELSQTNSNEDKYGSGKFTPEELIRSEVRGKLLAGERYDTIIWKIRSGYIVVLYGALALLGGTGLDGAVQFGISDILSVALILVWGFSLSGFIIDLDFLLSKLRVVTALNALIDLALRIALQQTNALQEYASLQGLLQMSGEASKPVDKSRLWITLRWLLPFYFVTPIMVTIIYLISLR
jgi:hypothetical protein